MPVTIGTLNSTLNIMDGGNTLNAATLEQIVQQVLARLKDYKVNETQMQEEQEIGDRATTSD
ncbi:hypothetical protein [Nostoc sp.]|uniref:hypothetical protein n=1 Tax=Nostoc sp. TaxID=1180 RepID=UPI002FFAE5FA